MHLILFGAGASTYSCGCPHPRPPMGDGLYDALVERHPAAKTVLNRDAQIAFETSKGFEAAMDQALQVGSLVMTPFLRELARFLISFDQCDCRANGYRRFIAGTRKSIRRTILSTLNYDVLLEWAAYRQSVDFAIDQPPLANRLQILKPHGSAGLLPYLDRNNRITNGVMRGLEGGYVGDMPMRFTFERSRLEEWMGDSSNSSLAPVMSVYAKGKYTPYNQPWVTSHRTLWTTKAVAASRVVIVGVRCVPDDRHIWEPLARSDAALTYVNPNSEHQAEFSAWVRGTRRRAASEQIRDGFVEALPLILKRLSS